MQLLSTLHHPASCGARATGEVPTRARHSDFATEVDHAPAARYFLSSLGTERHPQQNSLLKGAR
jgi:hypothetical protein